MTENRVLLTLARVTSLILHPLLIPTLGFILLFNSDFYFSFLPGGVSRVVLVTVFLSTCVLPAFGILILSLSPGFDIKMGKSTDRVMPLILTSIFYYVGYMILERFPIYPVFRFFLISSVLVQIGLLFVTLRWKISAHAAAIGGLLGGFLVLSLRLHENPVLILSAIILASGLVGSARLILGKHTVWQVVAGFFLGLTIMLAVFSFV